MPDGPKLSAIIPPELAGMRLDQALARVFDDYSRTNLKNWLLAGHILKNGAVAKPRDQVLGGEEVSIIEIPNRDEPDLPEHIALDIIFADDDLLVVNKPAGLVTHPGAGNRAGTMLNGLLFFDPGLSALPRAGIVHRLDKDTSGLMVVARSLPAHTRLVQALQEHQVQRTYQAICCNVPISGGTISAPIGRHPNHRTKMAVVSRGKNATTHYRLIKRYPRHAHLEVTLETGRTHQIRVHLSHAGFPLVGDPSYGGNTRSASGISASLRTTLAAFPRQALHAARLALEHPIRSEQMKWEAPLPNDFSSLLLALEQNKLGNAV
jgi:23S rRNA pseudouridine1911/1915/1917 synthase